MGGQEENGDEEEEDVGSENTPPNPELSSNSLTQSQAPPASSAPPSPPSSGAQMEDGRVLLDTWYVIKPGNTKEKIAFFVAHQFSGAELPRPSAMKVWRCQIDADQKLNVQQQFVDIKVSTIGGT